MSSTPMKVSTSIQTYTVGPSLGLLPPELKALIVEKIADLDFYEGEEDYEDEDDEEEEEEGEHDCSSHAPGVHGHSHAHSHGHGHGHGGDGEDEEDEHVHGDGCCGGGEMQMSNMLAIAMVNREFAELAYPFLWKAIHFVECDNAELARFIEIILPHHAEHVEMIHVNCEEFADYSDGSESPENTTIEAAIEAIVQTEKLESDYGSAYAGRQRQLLVKHIIERLPNLNTVEMTVGPSPSMVEDPSDVALVALQAIGSQIIDLTLDSQGDGCTAQYLANFLKDCPNLLRLDLEYPYLDRTGEAALITSIASLPKLTNLYISKAQFVNTEFAEATWAAPLRTLALSECEDLTFPSFITLISKFSATLHHLDLEDTPHTSLEKDNVKLIGSTFPLPHLETLVLGTLHESAFLESFASSPIEHLTIGFCPSITFPAWEKFISSHAKTLSLVVVQNDAELTEAQVESLELFCLTKGIDCEVEPEDSEDEDMEDMEDGGDYEGEEWEDEDEEEESDDE